MTHAGQYVLETGATFRRCPLTLRAAGRAPQCQTLLAYAACKTNAGWTTRKAKGRSSVCIHCSTGVARSRTNTRLTETALVYVFDLVAEIARLHATLQLCRVLFGKPHTEAGLTIAIVS